MLVCLPLNDATDGIVKRVKSIPRRLNVGGNMIKKMFGQLFLSLVGYEREQSLADTCTTSHELLPQSKN